MYNKSKNPMTQTKKEQELKLIRDAQKGRERAKRALLQKYERLIHKLARKFAFTAPSFQHEDLFQEGCIGLLQAIDSYDP